MKTFILILVLLSLCGCGCEPILPIGPKQLDIEPGAQVRANGPKLTPAANSKESLNKWVRAESAGDTYGTGLLLAGQQVVGLTAGTKCLYLGRDGMGICRLRVLEGPHLNAEVWVTVESVTAAP